MPRTRIRADGVTEDTIEDKDGDTRVSVEGSTDEDKIRFETDGAERMIIDNEGKVGIGTSMPTGSLHVVGTSKIQGDTFVTGAFNVTGSVQIKSDSLVNQKAIKFDGLSPFDEVTISDATTATSFSSGGGNDKPFTISMWVNLEEIDFDGTNGKHQGGLYTKRSTSPNDGEIYIGVGSGLLQFVLYADPVQNGVGTFSTSNRLVVAQSSGNFRFFHAENTWFHLCITYDGTKALTGIRIYKNSHPVGTGDILEGGGQSTTNADLNVPNLVFFGTMAATNYSGTSQTSIPTTLGGIDVNDSAANALAGKLADVCRFNRVLTHTEVQELYNGGNVKNMEEHSAYSDLVHWWKMGDHIDTIGQDGIKDYVSGYHGTLGGDASIVPETSLGSDVVSTWSVNSSGSLGVGTIKPDHPFHVIGSSKIEGDLELISGNTTVKSFNKLKTKSISFDGTDDYIEISDHDDFTFSDGSSDTPFSIQAWIKIEDTSTDEGTIIGKYNANTNSEWLFWQDNGVLRINLYDDNETPTTGNAIKLTTDSAVLSNDTWHHVVATYDGSESHTGLTAYVDGVAVAATTEQSNTYNGMVNTTVGVQIGGNQAGSFDFEKNIGSCAIFTKELTAAEVLELYNDGKVMNLEYHSAYSSILSWWKMGDDQDTTGTDGIKDYVGSHHGTLNGDASIVDESDLPSEFLESFRINTAGNVGVGTTTPEKKLHVYGDTKLQGGVQVDGMVGVGTASPTSLLTLNGSQPKLTFRESDSDRAEISVNDSDNLVITNQSTNKYVVFKTNDAGTIREGLRIGGVTPEVVVNEGSDSLVDFRVESDNNTHMLFVDGGNDRVGIGTNSPSQPLDVAGNANVSGDLDVGGTITTTNDISFQDNGGTFPTNTAGFFWDLNNDEARIYAKQPSSDAIDFVFKLSDNNHSQDRYVFWIDDYRGGSYDRYPLLMHGGEVLFHMTETSEGVPNGSTSKVRIDSNGMIAMAENASNPSIMNGYAHIYAKAGAATEVYVQDSNGNSTKISPHNPEGEWEYFSKNSKTGKVVKINMEKMIKRLEEITGESFMEEWYEDPTD